ncbi:fatty acid CoA ligase Acsl3 [Rhipicephalus sanguineus]|uniref:long-chain-fatty-acid--CoA ligase n=1 Tax=Rhipicephalus sanguineus TaxID=34632 RepID=A0A9D4T570_RHISA|nr:fatty acid CoA ligase Acsl3 [Rhipicephalus sanguineus]KAH7971729.1 hypothetical protein HPB52_002386 [Rhipicephalus sanguineus]
MNYFLVKIILFLVKVATNVCTVFTLPAYFVFQRPWNYWRRSKTRFAMPVEEDNPYAPYWRLHKYQRARILGHVGTLDQLARRAFTTWPERRCLGTRTILGRTETQKIGSSKVIKNVDLGDYQWLTYGEVDRKIDRTVRGLQSIGARPRQYLAIMAETRVEWFLTAHACFRSNIPLVTLCTTLGDDGLVSAINEAQVTHLVTSEDFLPRVQNVVGRMPSLTHVVCIENPDSWLPMLEEPIPKVIPFSSLECLGVDFVADSGAPKPDDVAVVMYTIASPGSPRGLVATHRNIIAAINGLGVVRKQFCAEDDTYIAYLPLAHVFELAVESLVFGTGTPIGYSSALTLTNASTGLAKGCRGDATLLRPTQMAAVPLIIERICKGISDNVALKGPLFEEFFNYAVEYKDFWHDRGFDTPLLNHFIFNDVRSVLGSRLRVLVCGSAPLSPRTRRFARACLGCHVIEAYGTTETCAVGTVSDIDDTSVGRVGAPVPGSYVRLVDWPEGSYFVSDKPNPRGEVVVGGLCVAQGYLNRKFLTRTAFRYENGVRWFYTGDVGQIFPDGTLKIIDRKQQEPVKLQCGENASLSHAETVLRMCPLVDNVLVYGSSIDAYLVALVAPNNDQLQRLARRIPWAMGRELTLQELCENAEVTRAATEFIRAFARRSGKLQKSEVPVKLKLCADEWTADTGLVTASFKIRRKLLQDFYERDIKALYATAEQSVLTQA